MEMTKIILHWLADLNFTSIIGKHPDDRFTILFYKPTEVMPIIYAASICENDKCVHIGNLYLTSEIVNSGYYNTMNMDKLTVDILLANISRIHNLIAEEERVEYADEMMKDIQLFSQPSMIIDQYMKRSKMQLMQISDLSHSL